MPLRAAFPSQNGDDSDSSARPLSPLPGTLQCPQPWAPCFYPPVSPHKTKLFEGRGGFCDLCLPGPGMEQMLGERWTPGGLLTWGCRVRVQDGPYRHPGGQCKSVAPEFLKDARPRSWREGESLLSTLVKPEPSPPSC